MRWLALALTFFAGPALAQQPNGVINSPIYATGYITQVGGTSVTTDIKANANHPTNLNIYTTGAISGTWSIKLPNPGFEGQVLSFMCGSTAGAISVTSSDGSAIDSGIPTSCAAGTNFAIQFDIRNNIWRSLFVNTITATNIPAFTGGDCTSSSGSVILTCTKTNGVAFAPSATTDTTKVYNVINAAPRVENNTALSALPSTYTTSIIRLGFAAAGDAPLLVYTPSGSACSLNAGAGDGGSQVPTSDGKCWVAVRPINGFSPLQFGAKCDNSTNDAAALQATITAFGSRGGIVDFTQIAGYCKSTGAIAVTTPILLRGPSNGSASIVFTGASSGFVVSAGSFSVEKMQIAATGSAYHTAIGIAYNAGLSGNINNFIRDSYIQGFSSNVVNNSNITFHVSNTTFSDFTGCGLALNNTNSDAGDSVVDGGNVFDGGLSNGNNIGLCVQSTSGLGIQNNKFIGEWGHISIAPTSGPSGDFRIINNSLEGHVGYAIQVSGAAAIVTKVQTIGNQISTQNGNSYIVYGTNVQNTITSGNIISGNSGGGSPSEIGISFTGTGGLTSARDHLVDGNGFYNINQSVSVTDTNSIGLQIGAGNKYGYSAAYGTNIFYSGGGALGTLNETKVWRAAAIISTSSTVAYTNPFKLQGSGRIKINTYGISQGAGYGECTMDAIVSASATVVNITANTCAGTTFNQQIISSGGFILVGAELVSGTSLYANMEIEISGQFSLVQRN